MELSVVGNIILRQYSSTPAAATYTPRLKKGFFFFMQYQIHKKEGWNKAGNCLPAQYQANSGHLKKLSIVENMLLSP
jgi:hypothetical protein